MPKCKNCEKKGFFLKVTADGLCEDCSLSILTETKQRMRVINNSVMTIEKSKNIKTKVSRFDVILDNAQALLRYEYKGIRAIDPLPSELISNAITQRDQTICEGVKEEVEKQISKAKLATTTLTSVNQASKALMTILEWKKELREPSLLDNLESKTKIFLHKTKLEGFLEAARKAEFKGQKKKALDQYQEALYFLRTDEIDDSIQKDIIEKLETKIKALEA